MKILDLLLGTLFKIVQGTIIICLLTTAILVPTKVACDIAVLSIIVSVVCGISALVILFAAYGFNGVIKSLTAQVNALTAENNRYTELNSEYASLIDSQKKEITKMEMIQNKTQELLKALMDEGDNFKEFGKILRETTDKNIDLTDKLELLTKDLLHEKFKELDLNEDGVLTKSEILKFKK